MDNAVHLGIKIRKRDGQIVEFSSTRITRAIAGSFKEQAGLPREADLGPDVMKDVQKVTDKVAFALKERGAQKPFLTAEEIQDEVIRQLYENGHKEIAQCYASYRRHNAGQRKLFELYRVIKRDGKVVVFKQEKISLAITKAFVAHNKSVCNAILIDKAQELSDKAVSEIFLRWPEGKSIHIEEVQDIVEKVVMAAGYYEVAKRYILYREERAKARRNLGTGGVL
jgi:ribonucleoside-diphosphate reductase alpha chain